MKTKIYSAIFLFLGAFTANQGMAQQEKLIYAVTDSVRNGMKWNYLRSVNPANGNFSNVLTRLLGAADTLAFANGFGGVAAIALDQNKKRVYFTPMQLDRLSYVDLRTLRVHTLTNNFTGLVPKSADQGNVITRMVIVKEKGYALTNDGKNLIRFSTNNNPVVRNLGALIDDPGNGAASVHNACTSYGGDLIAGKKGFLYLVTSFKHIFRINPKTRVAKLLGVITGLPSAYNVSGASADKSGENIVVASNTDPSGLFRVNPLSLQATSLRGSNTWMSADLASGYILDLEDGLEDCDDDDDDDNRVVAGQVNGGNEKSSAIAIYPNPVTASRFNIDFSDAEAGSYMINLIDLNGKSVFLKNVMIANDLKFGRIHSVNLPQQISNGAYLVAIRGNNGRNYSAKIVVQTGAF